MAKHIQGSEIFFLREKFFKEWITLKELIPNQVNFMTAFVFTTIDCREFQIILEFNELFINWIERLHKDMVNLIFLVNLDGVNSDYFR